MSDNRYLPQTAVILCGALLAFWLARGFFLHPAQAFYANHEADSYAGRLVEFREQLAVDPSPQWCPDFRSGLGAPHFNYYQPGFFYLAALAGEVPVVRALGVAVFVLALLGYGGAIALVAKRFGLLSGWLAGCALLLSSYAGTDIYVRGDLSEFGAMMLVPVALWALWGWLDRGGRAHAVSLALASGALVIFHPAVALVGYGVMALALVVFAWQTRAWGRVLAAALALGVGAGLASFYWLPVFFEWRLVKGDAFTGFYHFSHHFVQPWELLRPYDRSAVVPLSLGSLLPPLAAVNLLVLAWRRRQSTPEQRRLAVFGVVALAVCVYLMTPASSPIWEHAPLLYKLQFPWRILTVVTVLLALLAGAVLPWPREGCRAAVVVGLVVALAACSWHYSSYQLDAAIRLPETAADLRGRHFAPDVCNEWLPRGATAEIEPDASVAPSPGEGCEVKGFQRKRGELRCEVRASRDSYVVLPHYFFPVGFRATFSGEPVALEPDARGLMKIDLPAGCEGALEVRCTRTPMRRFGLVLSALSLLALAGLGWLAGRMQVGPVGAAHQL